MIQPQPDVGELAENLGLWFSSTSRKIPQVLIAESTWGFLRSASKKFPLDVLAAIEFRLDHQSDVDLSIRLETPEQVRLVAPLLPAGPRQDFLRAWAQARAEGRSAFSEIQAVWLEFDAADGEPIYCVRLHDTPAARDAEFLLAEIFPAIHGVTAPRQAELVRRMIDALPETGRVLYAFSLDPRPGRGIRLELFDLDAEQIPAYLLRTIGEEAASRIEQIRPLFRDAGRLHLSLDAYDSGFSPRIGVEIGWPRLPAREPRWRESVERFTEAGLCLPEKGKALFDWPGWDTPTTNENWPRSIRRGYCVRSLSHYKLVSTPETLTAKAYFLLQYLPRKPNS